MEREIELRRPQRHQRWYYALSLSYRQIVEHTEIGLCVFSLLFSSLFLFQPNRQAHTHTRANSVRVLQVRFGIKCKIFFAGKWKNNRCSVFSATAQWLCTKASCFVCRNDATRWKPVILHSPVSTQAWCGILGGNILYLAHEYCISIFSPICVSCVCVCANRKRDWKSVSSPVFSFFFRFYFSLAVGDVRTKLFCVFVAAISLFTMNKNTHSMGACFTTEIRSETSAKQVEWIANKIRRWQKWFEIVWRT